MHEHHKKIAILYHGGCPDGFGGAYAAWKKFGDTAEYIPVKYGQPVPGGLEGRTVYFVDFCYPKEMMDALITQAAHVVVLDHHQGAKEVVEQMPEFIFDENRSGATIAWNYFRPDIPVPKLLKYVEDGDLYLFSLPDSRAVLSYMYAQPFHFDMWDALALKLETDSELSGVIALGKVYAEHFQILIEQICNKAILVSFEGYECYLATAPFMFTSDVGNHLARAKPPLAIIANFHGDVLNISLRSDPSIDLLPIAKKYGGGGHPHAAGFRIAWGDPLLWNIIEEHEDPRH